MTVFLHWLLRRLDSAAGAVFAALGFVLASQFQEFLQQYLQRLGGHLDEARANYLSLVTGGVARTLDPALRETVVAGARARVDSLDRALAAIRDAGPVTRPFQLVTHIDLEIARATFAAYQPAVPTDPLSLAYAAAGLILGLVVWELVKLPPALIFRRRRLRPGR
ncbi:MAG: DUF2937 family protein [Proteobacteria bacterium]|nr:DUF2937 family protein [Pseudomonadota bacterium]MBI3497495.1 DUF2937 family protein [Pseudomonadota bacterium]